MKTAQVVIGEKLYDFTPLTVDQLERMAEATEGVSPQRAGFALFRIMMENATPKVDDLKNMIISPNEIRAVVTKVNEISGIVTEDDPAAGEAKPAG